MATIGASIPQLHQIAAPPMFRRQTVSLAHAILPWPPLPSFIPPARSPRIPFRRLSSVHESSITVLDHRDSDCCPLLPISLPALHHTLQEILSLLKYPTHQVSLSLVDDDTMRQLNRDTRQMDLSTDILSFGLFDRLDPPGVLPEPPAWANRTEYQCLGDLVVSVEYVRQRCEEDRRQQQQEEQVSAIDNVAEHEQEKEEEEGHHEYHTIEVEVDEYDDRGVAPAMLRVFNPEVRIHMLLVHGMLHLVGYDHEDDDDYELMVEKEDEILAELKRKLGDNFGVSVPLALESKREEMR